MTRKTILILASSISPVRGSEYAVGWDHVTNLALDHDLIVLYGFAGEHMGDFDEMVGINVPGVTFVPVAPDRWARLLNAPNRAGHLTFSFYLAYRRWQRQAYRVARQICDERHVDIVHYLCPIGYREPGYLWKLGKPYIWGPISGMSSRPVRVFFALNPRQGIRTALRNAVNWVQFRANPRLRRALRSADVLLTNTAENAALLKDVHGVETGVIPENGIVEIDSRPKAVTAPTEPLRLLWVGRLDTAKALDFVLKALSRTPGGWKLDIAGDGPRRQGLEQMARTLGLDKGVTWHGHLPRADLAELYRTADVHILSSLAEAHSTVLWEAMAHHTPTIAFDHCGMHDSICDNCGIRVPLGEMSAMTAGLAEALKSLIERRDEVRRLVAGTWQCAERNSWERRRAFWRATYETAIERHRLRDAA